MDQVLGGVKTMLIKSKFLMVFFWMDFGRNNFFGRLYIAILYIYIYIHHFFGVAAIHSRRSWDTGGDVFSMYCHSKNDLSKRCSMFGIQQHPPSRPAFSSYSNVPPKNMSFSCIYIYV